MIKKFLTLALMLICICIANAQQPLPLNPEVKHGVLPNGLTYYILHNDHPQNRANFYIAQKVGSALETPEQYGLAHFLEHMAFNGTKHYPGDSMLRYLESKGIHHRQCSNDKRRANGQRAAMSARLELRPFARGRGD